MKRIHSLNYEAYALDYLEGTLPPDEQEAFEAFLERHPEIAAEIEGLDDIKLTPPAMVYPNASSLYRREEKAYWGWAAAAGWLLLISLSATWWMVPSDQPSIQSVAAVDHIHDEMVSIERVQVSPSAQSRSIASDLAAAVQPLPRLEPVAIPDLRKQPSQDAAQSYSRSMDVVMQLPLNRPNFVYGDAVVVTTRPAYGAQVVEQPADREASGTIDPNTIGVYEPLSQLLTEDQKNWVAQWRPIENLKEEVSRNRWADAITPQYFSSSKSTK